jgi:hypothetical protein
VIAELVAAVVAAAALIAHNRRAEGRSVIPR